MLIPHYSISIEQSGEIFINHKCIKTNIKRNIKDLYNDLILEKNANAMFVILIAIIYVLNVTLLYVINVLKNIITII